MLNRDKISLLLNNCSYDILTYIDNSNRTIQFTELKKLSNSKTNKKYSTSTISDKLKKLVKEDLIEKVILDKNSRYPNGYNITKKAKKSLILIKETTDKYEKL